MAPAPHPVPGMSSSQLRFPPASLALMLLCACSSWQRAEEYDGWSLYVQSGEPISIEVYAAAVEPAFEVVENRLGTFNETVRVHAWDGGVTMEDGTRGRITRSSDEAVAEVPGIGPARVRAFHADGGGGPFSQRGVFVGTAEVGTIVHELVHAHMSERGIELPLWFEEGFAMMLGDGAMHEGVWVVDGLACWPWRELRDEPLDDATLERLLRAGSGDTYSVRDNVLVHFLGWAIVLDLYREHGELDWRELLQLFNDGGNPVAEARQRLDRTLEDRTPSQWLERLRDPDPGVRLAAARGTWKLHSRAAQRTLLDALRVEEHPDVRASLAVNSLATAGQVRLGRRQTGYMWRLVFPVLRSVQLQSSDETSALRTLYRAYRNDQTDYDTQAALERLDRFWED